MNKKKKLRPYSAKVEIIRDPLSHYTVLPFTSFKSGNYLKQKMDIYKHKFTPLNDENPNLEVNKRLREEGGGIV